MLLLLLLLILPVLLSLKSSEFLLTLTSPTSGEPTMRAEDEHQSRRGKACLDSSNGGTRRAKRGERKTYPLSQENTATRPHRARRRIVWEKEWDGSLVKARKSTRLRTNEMEMRSNSPQPKSPPRHRTHPSLHSSQSNPPHRNPSPPPPHPSPPPILHPP